MNSIPPKARLAWVVVLSALVLSIIVLRQQRPAAAPSVAKPPGAAPAASTPTGTPATPAPAPVASPIPVARGGVRLRPLAVAQESGQHQWTVGDGRSDAVISQLAHNFDEYQRMVEENDRIKRRQLVYRKETVAELVQRARLTGAAVRQLTLPGLDGQEIQFEVTRADLAPSGQSGTLAGHVAGRAQSMITFAYKFGREAFSVISPEDGVFLQADPWEPGELIVKSIDPATYVPGECGNP